MPDRPSIPKEVVDAVFVASGHRCAVCGVPFPLEKAHIVPWHSSKSHSAENLICLCANCHERADREHWGEAVLKAYKKIPWVLRQNGSGVQVVQDKRRRRIVISIAKDFDDFGQYEENVLTYALANYASAPRGGQAPPPVPDYSDLEDTVKEREGQVAKQQRDAADNEKKWADFQHSMISAFSLVDRLDKNRSTTSAEKQQTWKRFLSDFSAENPFVTTDNWMRDHARMRLKFLSLGNPRFHDNEDGTVLDTHTGVAVDN